MNSGEKKKMRIAILDLYDGFDNQGMRCLREIVWQFAVSNDVEVESHEFDVRQKLEIPDTSWDVYLSSGGPGDPLESEGLEWDNLYFDWLGKIGFYNNDPKNIQKKYVFFICHSFQLACRHFKVAELTKRKSTAFGVFPVHLLEAGKTEPVFEGMPDPFYAVDSRDYQVVQPNKLQLKETGASVLCIEKERPHVPYERAVMGIRFSDYFIGTQFHPEADALGMKLHLQSPERKKTVIENYGEAKWHSMIERLNDPDKIVWTHDHIIPNFLKLATGLLINETEPA
ncbi:MAG TPA: GMP synthase [Hanamia sp.]|jgi:GMP synthase-like glutamine amidotransferase|nr:GMP synthase [Hanamia sp.]